MHHLSDYQFDLPEKLIAQHSVKPTDHAKMLVCTKQKNTKNMTQQDKHFYDLPDVIGSDTVLFFNNTKVIKARVPITSAIITRNYMDDNHPQKKVVLSDGEIFIYKVHSFEEGTIEVLVSDGKHFKPDTTIDLQNGYYIKSKEFTKDGMLMKLHGGNLIDFLEKYAELPLPPYISYDKKKEADYQSIFATSPGSVAAPTASLHFTKRLLTQLQAQGNSIEYLTLHISLGTFKPINVDNIDNYVIHAESAQVHKDIFTKIACYKKNNKPIVSVGSTATRTLESLTYLRDLIKNRYPFDTTTKDFRKKCSQHKNKQQADIISNVIINDEHISFDTALYISPGYTPLIIDGLITNFHLPGTSLLVMVAALMGFDNQQKAYNHAIQSNYRFYSFGDGMLIQFT